MHISALPPLLIGLGLNLPLLGLNLGLRGSSEAPEAQKAPQRPLRGPSWVSIWASKGEGYQFGLGIALSDAKCGGATALL